MGMLIAAVVVPLGGAVHEEKGTLAPVNIAQEIRKIEETIELVTATPTFVPTASPTPTPEPTPSKTEKLVEIRKEPFSEPIIETKVFVLSTPEIVYDAVCNQGLAWDCQQALNIAWCESRWQVWKVNPSGATGLFQVMLPLWWKYMDGDPLDPYVNARAAYRVYAERGNWSAWACYPYG